jgi:hypothetical protein
LYFTVMEILQSREGCVLYGGSFGMERSMLMSRYLRILLTSVWVCVCLSVGAAEEGAQLQRMHQLYMQAEQVGLAAPYTAPLP